MIGQSILDYIMSPRFDPLYGCEYKAMTCINNDDLNIRCKTKDTNRVIYAIKASAQSNNDMILSLRAAFNNGYINLLKSENMIEDSFGKNIKGYSKLTDNQQIKMKVPYAQTSALIEELVNLEHELSNNKIKVKEKSGMRKDRFSSILYNNYVVDQIRQDRKRKTNTKSDIMKMFSVRASSMKSRYN